MRWHIFGKDICKQCWMQATAISSYRITHYFKNRHSCKNISRMSDYIQTAICWMNFTFSNMGEKLPHKEEIHLPSFLSWKDIHHDLSNYLMLNTSKTISFSYFCSLRKKYFSSVIIPEKTRLGKCDICLTLQQQKINSSDPTEYQRLSDQFMLHNQLQMKERLLYKQRTVTGRMNPAQYLSIIIDSMQHKFIPMFTPLPKNYSTCEKLKLHLTGIINHTHADRILYGSFDHWPHGSNFIVSLLNDYLKNLQIKLEQEHKEWPSTMFIQLDNCWKENKNKYFFSYLATLLYLNIFEEIYMYCLPSGHTHEDIDQMFSSFSVCYWKNGFPSIPKMDSFLVKAYPTVATRPRFKMVTAVWDMKTFYTNVLVDIRGYTSYRAFWFHKDAIKNVIFNYKESSLQDTWLGKNSNVEGVSLFSRLPIGEPTLCDTVPLSNSSILQPLQNSAVKAYLDTEDINWFISLSTNNTFYFPRTHSSFFTTLHTFYSREIAQNVVQQAQIEPIIVNQIQQHQIQGKCSKQLIGKYGIFNSPYGGYRFTVGLIFDCSEFSYIVTPYKSESLQHSWEVEQGKYLSLLADALIHSGSQNAIFDRNNKIKTRVIQNILQRITSFVPL